MNAPARPHRLDHLVLPVSALDEARARLVKLGFTVAPDAHHPFGTANCCVFFADGTYLEPLSPANFDRMEDAIRVSNVFVGRFLAYRFRRGEDGFSAVAFATDDAALDHQTFAETGWSAGPMLEFSRDFEAPGGAKVTASFRLAFAHDWRAPDCLFFTCQRIDFPPIDRSALQRHDNGVVGIRRVVLGAPSAAFFAAYLEAASGVDRKLLSFERNDMISLPVGDVGFDLMDNRSIAINFDRLSSEDSGLQGRAIIFGVKSYRDTEALLTSRGIAFFKFRKRIVVPPMPGQGTIFAFEASS